MPKKKERNIIAYVMNLPEGAVASIRRYEKICGQKYRVMIILDSRVKDPSAFHDQMSDIIVHCDFSDEQRLASALLPYQEELLAVTCRSEKSMARFASVIPHVPYLRTPTTESLRWASDKYEMRRKMKIYDPKITPIFTLVKDTSKKEQKRVAEKVGFPMIIKPTNLSGSLFVSVCYHEEDLGKTLKLIFRKIRKAYEADNRPEEPKVIAEEYMNGDLYSIDSYVGTRGKVRHCPLVEVTTGKKIGRDDFFGYIQMTPPPLKKRTVEDAELVAEKAIHALGLRSTITHTELMRVDNDWKVIEIGARMGGFRHELYMLTHGIDHSLNDILVRIPRKVVVPKKGIGYACTMKWYVDKEGVITEMKGIKKVEELKSFHKIDINKKVGDRAKFARNGGRSVFNLFLKNKERSKLLADIRRVEQMVKINVKGR